MKPSPKELRELARRDPVLGRAMKRVPPFPSFPDAAQRVQRTHYEALARAIVFQQLAGAAARTIHGRVCALTPGPRFPSAQHILSLPDERLRGAGLSRNKLLALRDLARRIESGELKLPSLGRCDDERIIEALTEVRGIGVWSAQMFLMFRLGRLDVMPTTDLGVREGARRLDGLKERPTPNELLERSEVWKPLRTVASWVLWRIAEEKPAARAK